MRRLENSLRKDPQIKILSPSLLEIIEPDEEDEFERNGYSGRDGRSRKSLRKRRVVNLK